METSSVGGLSASRRLLRPLLGLQGLYYLATGVWPLVSLDTFMQVTGPKTERHEGKAERWGPTFPELRPYLLASSCARGRFPTKTFETSMWPRRDSNPHALTGRGS